MTDQKEEASIVEEILNIKDPLEFQQTLHLYLMEHHVTQLNIHFEKKSEGGEEQAELLNEREVQVLATMLMASQALVNMNLRFQQNLMAQAMEGGAEQFKEEMMQKMKQYTGKE